MTRQFEDCVTRFTAPMVSQARQLTILQLDQHTAHC